MKLKSLFKKQKSSPVQNGTQVLDKKQLEKVVGGAEGGKLTMPVGSGISGTTN